MLSLRWNIYSRNEVNVIIMTTELSLDRLIKLHLAERCHTIRQKVSIIQSIDRSLEDE